MEEKHLKYIITADKRVYNFQRAFKELPVVPWQQKRPVQSGSIVYIYATHGHSHLIYVTIALENNLAFAEIIDDEDYWHDKTRYEKGKSGLFVNLFLLEEIVDTERYTFKKLHKNGLVTAQGHTIYVNEQLAAYLKPLEKAFVSFKSNEQKVQLYYEGTKQPVLSNKYERNPLARQACIEHYGTSCQICGFSFKETYGEFAEGFIHVHHITPLADTDGEKEINPIKDLIPVCPNCHAMLHKKDANGNYKTVDEIKKILNK